MKKLVLYFLGLQVFFVTDFVSAGNQSVCSGEVMVANKKEHIVLTLPTSELKEGDSIKLSGINNSETQDNSIVKIQKIIQVSWSKFVIATYESPSAGIISFKYYQDILGAIYLTEFKGFEGALPFGPSQLFCQ